jgi:hypothetical protein
MPPYGRFFTKLQRDEDLPGETLTPAYLPKNAAPTEGINFGQEPESGGFGAGASNTLPAPPPVIPSNRADSMNRLKRLSVSPSGVPQSGVAEGAEPDQQGPPMPPAMATGAPKPPMSAAAQDLEKYRTLEAPPKPKNNLWQTIGQTALGFTRFGPAAEQIIHPKYSADMRDYGRQRETLADQINEDAKVEGVESLTENRHVSQANRKMALEGAVQNRADAITAKAQGQQEKLLSLAPNGIRRVSADAPPLTAQEQSHITESDDIFGDPGFKIRIDSTHGLTPLPKDIADHFHLPVGIPVEASKILELAKEAYKVDNKADPAAQENLNHWVAVSEDPDASAADKATAEAKINRLKSAQVTTRVDIHNATSGSGGAEVEIKPGTRDYRTAQDLASGDLTFSQLMRIYSGRNAEAIAKRAAVYDAARRMNSAFTPADFEAGYNFAKSPKIKAQVASLNNVENGVGDLLKFSDRASRAGANVLNKFINPGGIAVGGKSYNNFHSARIAFADELSGALGYGTATDMAKQMGLDLTDPNMSPENFRSSIEDVVVPFVARKRASILGQMGPYGAPRGNSPPEEKAGGGTGKNGGSSSPDPKSAYVAGHVYGGKTFLGGNPNSAGSWK